LINGDGDPAARLQNKLKQAGDVEENPGPARACGECNRPIRLNNNPRICSQCGGEAHAGCTRLTRAQLKKNELYTCTGCMSGEGGGAVDDGPRAVCCGGAETNLERNTCVMCGRAIRTGAPREKCRECGGEAHFKCTGRLRGARDTAWKCPGCQGPPPVVAEEVVEPPEEGTQEGNNDDPLYSNKTCPTCWRKLRVVAVPLICRGCKRAYHMKCAPQTRKALEIRRRERSWMCHHCEQMSEETGEFPREEDSAGRLLQNRAQIKIVQWNCDFLQTKVDELSEYLRDGDVDVAILQETKLGINDPTPRIEGYVAVRKDRKGSGTVHRRGGGLITYLKKDIPHWTEDIPTSSVAEIQLVHVPISERENISIANIYVPPVREGNAAEEWRKVMTDLDGLPRNTRSLWGGDFNAHHPLWDQHMETDHRGETLEEWMMERNMVTCNDGTPTRHSWDPEREGRSAPDLTMVDTGNLGAFIWRTEQVMSSDHVPICITWNRELKVDKTPRRYDLNVKKANWGKYVEEIKGGIALVTAERGIPQKYKLLRDLIQRAMKSATPTKVIRKVCVPWMNDEIKKARKKRNILRRDMRRNKQRWLDICREIRTMEEGAKRRVWRENLDKIKETKDTARAWDLVRNMRGQASESSSKVLSYRGRCCITKKAKANAFVQEYAEVSKIKGSKMSRRREGEVRGKLKNWTNVTGPDFTMAEIKKAVKKLKPRKAAGRDGIRSEYVIRLPDEALVELLKVYNHSRTTGWLPQDWRTAVIIPILKKGKDPAEVSSYRPIALLSHLGKLLERMIGARLVWWLESTGTLNQRQAGYRKGRSTTDQCLRMSQHISDAFQEKPPARTLLTLFDYSKAFDTVWRTGLLDKMLDKGVPAEIVGWIRAWLVNRRMRVSYDGVESRERTMAEGLPQGAVLSPTLFIVFVDDLLGRISEEAMVSAYADDLAIAVTNTSKEIAQEEMQVEVSLVEEWSREWILKLNPDKCEVCLFSTDTSEASWKPTLALGGTTIKENKSPTFLGVTYDPQLSFSRHASKVSKKMVERSRLLYAVGGASWGWARRDMRQIYTATQRSIAEYASPAWTPWLSPTNKEAMERAQLRAARIIGGTTKSTPREAVLREAGLQPLKERHEAAAAIKMDRWEGLPPEDYRAQVATREVRKRTKRSNCRVEAGRVAEKAGIGRREHEERRAWVPPWEERPPLEIRLTDVRKSDPGEVQLERAREALERAEPLDTIIYTDGSATGGTHDGGAGMVVFRGEQRISEWSGPAGRLCSSYQAEMVALRKAVEWLGEDGEWRAAGIVTDSRALVDALCGEEPTTSVGVLRGGLERLRGDGREVKIVWVPSHCGLDGNEAADEMARRGAELEQGDAPLEPKTREAALRRACKRKSIDHPRLREVYTRSLREEEEDSMGRADRVDLTRFRTGHHPRLGKWRRMVEGGEEADPGCRLCGEGGEESSEHLWMDCPAFALDRMQMELGDSMDELVRSPVSAMALLRKILRRLGD
jgi:ribonuclease HI